MTERIISEISGDWRVVIEYNHARNLYGTYEYITENGIEHPYPVHVSYSKTLQEAKESTCSAFWDILGVHQN